MPRVQPVLTEAEDQLVDRLAAMTGAKRTDVMKSAVSVYHWFVTQALTGARVVARRPDGQDITLQTPELSALEARGNQLEPEVLAALSRQLAAATDPSEVARLNERIVRGFYGI
jgi:hypothetical protein